LAQVLTEEYSEAGVQCRQRGDRTAPSTRREQRATAENTQKRQSGDKSDEDAEAFYYLHAQEPLVAGHSELH